MFDSSGLRISTDHEYEIWHDLLRTWYDTVQYFSAKYMTKEEDQHPALSHITKRIQEVVSNQYLAELREQNLRAGLCWYTEKVVRYRQIILLPHGLRHPCSTVRYDKDISISGLSVTSSYTIVIVLLLVSTPHAL